MVDTRIWTPVFLMLVVVVLLPAVAYFLVVSGRRRRSTRWIDIDAPVEQVWSWLVEIGMDGVDWRRRGLLGSGVTSGISPTLRCPDGPQDGLGAEFEVVRIDAPRLVVGQRADGLMWSLELDDRGAGRSRLVSRLLSGPAPERGRVVRDRLFLRRMRTCAEAGAPLPRTAVTSPVPAAPLLHDTPTEARIDIRPLAPQLVAVRGELDTAGVD